MAMSKKDYQAIARAVYMSRLGDVADDRMMVNQSIVFGRLTERLAEIMAADNPRFDRARFVEACETGRCKGMAR